MARDRGKRAVTDVVEIASYSADGDEYRFKSLYERWLCKAVMPVDKLSFAVGLPETVGR
jgi:hypothetical protein